jgi:hypothetical protein
MIEKAINAIIEMDKAVTFNRGLIVRSLLRDISDEDIFLNFSTIRDLVITIKCGELLFLEIDKRFKKSNMLNFIKYGIKNYHEIIELVNYFDFNNKLVSRLLIAFVSYSKNMDKAQVILILSKLLPILYAHIETDKIDCCLNDCGVSEKEVHSSNNFLAAVCDQPQLLLPMVSANFPSICRQVNSHQAYLSHFLFDLLIRKKISKDSIQNFFNIKERYKLKFISAIRRYTTIIKTVSKEITRFSEISELVRSGKDILFVATLGLRMKIDEFKKIIMHNSTGLTTEELIYCYSQYGYLAKTATFINRHLRKNNLSPIEFKPTESVKKLFRLMISSDVFSFSKHFEGRVSVILSTHNPNMELLKISIESIQQQTYKNIEIILVDDCSDNGSEIKTLVQQYDNVNYFCTNSNSGPYICRNIGLEHATGMYIAFQDDDDISHPQRIEFQINKLNETKARIVTACHLRFDNKARLQIDMNTGVMSDGPITMVMKKSLFDILGKFRPFRSRGDVEFRQRCIRAFGEASYHQDTIPLYYALGSHQTLSSCFEYANFAKLKFQRRMISMEAL